MVVVSRWAHPYRQRQLYSAAMLMWSVNQYQTGVAGCAKNDIGTDVIKRKVMPLLSRLFPVQKPHAGCQFMRLYQQEATEEIEVAGKTKTWLTASLVSVRGSFYEFLDFMPLIFGAAILPMRK